MHETSEKPTGLDPYTGRQALPFPAVLDAARTGSCLSEGGYMPAVRGARQPVPGDANTLTGAADGPRLEGVLMPALTVFAFCAYRGER